MATRKHIPRKVDCIVNNLEKVKKWGLHSFMSGAGLLSMILMNLQYSDMYGKLLIGIFCLYFLISFILLVWVTYNYSKHKSL